MFRRISQLDKAVFLEMEYEFYHSDATLHPIPQSHFEATFNALMENTPFADCFMFEEKGEVFGFALLAITFSNEGGGICVWVEEIYVRPQFQGRGTGKEFFRFLQENYPQAKRFRLEIEEDNISAKRLYEKMGFEVLPYQQMVKDL